MFGTDDTAAIRATLAAAVAFGQANTNEAEVIFSAKLYIVNGAPVQGGTTKGNAQIPLPQVPLTGPKLLIKLTGLSDTPTNTYSINSTCSTGSSTLVCTRGDGTLDGTYGPASVVGGPTFQQTSGTVTSNVRVVWEGITILLPYPSTYCGFDAFGIQGVCIRSMAVNALCTPAQATNPPLTITSGVRYVFGLRTPTLTNDGDQVIDNYVAYALGCGLVLGEHVSASRGFCIYCFSGIAPFGTSNGTGMTHTARLHVWCCEACNVQLNFNYYATDSPLRIDIGTFDIDTGNGAGPLIINDPNSQGQGEICIRGNANVYTFSAGMSGLRIISNDQNRGHVTAPGLPGTATPLLNPFWRDAAVAITPGASTCAVTIDGTATGIILASGGAGQTFLLPTGKTIQYTATAAPSWTWVLL